MHDFWEKVIEVKNEKNICLTGMTDEFFCIYLSNLFKKEKRDILVVTSTLYEANILYEKSSNYSENSLLFPMDDFLTSESIAISPDLMVTRLDTLSNLLNCDNHIVITHLNGLLRFLPLPNTYKNNIIYLKKDDVFSREKLIKKLYSLGYKKETIVTTTGEFGVRGFVIDVFPIDFANPVRIEYFDDVVDSIRIFDETSQKTIKEIDNVTINPYTEFLTDEELDIEDKYLKQKYLPNYTEVVSICNYLNNPIVIFKDYNSIINSNNALNSQLVEYKESKKDVNNYMFDFDKMKFEDTIYYNSLSDSSINVSKNKIFRYDVKSIDKFNENIEVINKYLKDCIALKKTVIICLKKYQIKNFIRYLDCHFIVTNFDNIIDENINIVEGNISEGFSYKNFIILTENELFKINNNKKRYKTSFKSATRLKNISNIEIGDYVVSESCGIGIYNGIKSLSQNGVIKDYLEINYADKDKLYIPIEKIDLISKYTGKEGIVPKINKLGSIDWQKTKQKIKNRVKNIASDLIKLYAEREMQKGFKFSPDNELQLLFEQEFEYQETNDQLLAISQIKNDMESDRPMDRLLCGDVGFGKTEVAFRAMFKAVLDSEQVLYLCPTTILSMQQYENALARFKNYPVKIGCLNRFTSRENKEQIINDLKNGKIDIVFGTHRLLSKDVEPKNLGLLVIDEEQRFGVTHKEKIKQYKENVDVLTLTATPIPRTLQMSLIGIRSLSLIETPPTNRYPVQTYVIEENIQLVKDAIYKELSRNGQVFIIYNRIDMLEEKLYELKNLVPEARIVYTHGRLTKDELENRMNSFINHEYDILLCTTIIETGIDIPNVNTLIIYDADHFGLSQLYQIRGRVGRSNKIAYAYLMYNPHKELNDVAIKRLNVIKEFTELGSGFSIATRDLSIRGAGDILGSEQAGFIDSVGIDLYLKILDDEIKKLKGIEVEESDDLNSKPLLQVSTHIEDSYVDNQNLKIEIHRMITQIDSYDKLIEVKTELEDRFGKLDEDMIIYMYEEWFERVAKKLDIIKVEQTKNSILLVFSSEMSNKIDSEKLFVDACKLSRMFRFSMSGENLVIILDTIKLDKHYIYYLLALLNKLKLK